MLLLILINILDQQQHMRLSFEVSSGDKTSARSQQSTLVGSGTRVSEVAGRSFFADELLIRPTSSGSSNIEKILKKQRVFRGKPARKRCFFNIFKVRWSFGCQTYQSLSSFQGFRNSDASILGLRVLPPDRRDARILPDPRPNSIDFPKDENLQRDYFSGL